MTRPDVTESASKLLMPYFGLVLEYLVPESMVSRSFRSISIELDNDSSHQFEGPFEFVTPHYRALFESEQVYHRENIYGSGPPNPVAQPEAVALAKELATPSSISAAAAAPWFRNYKEPGLRLRA